MIAAAPELVEKDPRCKLGVWLFGRSLAHLSFGVSFPLCISQAASAQLDVQGDVFDPANRLAVKAGTSQDVTILSNSTPKFSHLVVGTGIGRIMQQFRCSLRWHT